MGVRTIEQKMNAATLWDGAAPSGALDRAIAHDATDNVVKATKTWQFANGAFTAADVGRFLLMGATASGNDGVFTIAAVNSATEIETTESPGNDEVAGATAWTQDIYGTSGASVPANDMEAFPEGVKGGLFDFANENPIIVQHVIINFGSGTTSWTLSLVDIDSVETVVATVASAAPYFASLWNGKNISGLILLQGQKLKLESVGGPTTASRARISVARA